MSFSHVKEHKFKHNLRDTLDPFCNCQLDIKTTAHFFLHCHNFMHQRQTLLGSLSQTDHDILKLDENLVTDTLLFGNLKNRVSINSEILMTSIFYIL